MRASPRPPREKLLCGTRVSKKPRSAWATQESTGKSACVTHASVARPRFGGLRFLRRSSGECAVAKKRSGRAGRILPSSAVLGMIMLASLLMPDDENPAAHMDGQD